MKDKVVETLNTYGAMTSKQCAVLINRDFHVTCTAAQVAGALRPLIAKGEASNSKDANGKTVYWMNKERW